ncbi:transglycosylase SLT domain-containing protein [Rhodococcus qingshengii]|uniref:transglycosylase SLT domain-containing protein n=1 Tax=Rhodococcus qingshengii TaxID=334542 RepID=UPI0035E1FA39
MTSNFRAGGLIILAFLGLGAFNAFTGILKGRETPDTSTVSNIKPMTHNGSHCNGSEQLDQWINEARAIMAQHNIPGSYEGICRNIIRESGGNPNAINDWDINWQNGVPSIGLLQVIKPTWDAHWKPEFGVPNDQYDPVANIVVACQYAWKRYGSMDNVDGPY